MLGPKRNVSLDITICVHSPRVVHARAMKNRGSQLYNSLKKDLTTNRVSGIMPPVDSPSFVRAAFRRRDPEQVSPAPSINLTQL
jgi:hypothetical protein